MGSADGILGGMVQRLVAAAGPQLESVVLHGPAARGEDYGGTLYHLIVVLDRLAPGSLALLSDPIRWWRRRGQPMPRLFSPAFIAASADVFPMELLEIARHREILHGRDPFVGVAVNTSHLRLQCERELREKLMRLCEAYVEAREQPGALARLLVASYVDFAEIFRGCLYLGGDAPPPRSAEVVTRFCELADIDPQPFRAVERLARGQAGEPRALFAPYHEALCAAIHAVDRFTDGGEQP